MIYVYVHPHTDAAGMLGPTKHLVTLTNKTHLWGQLRTEQNRNELEVQTRKSWCRKKKLKKNVGLLVSVKKD